jgi:hypothetical protein
MAGGTERSTAGFCKRALVDEQRTRTKTSTKGKAKPSQVHVSLDNADTVIEGGPPFPMLLFASPQVGVPHVSRFSKRGRHGRLQRSDGSHRELRLGPILQLAQPRFAESIRLILGAGDISGDDTTPRLNSGLVQTKLQMEGLVGERGFEPPTPWSRTRFKTLLKLVEFS